MSEELATCRADLEKQKILNERLENDLMHVDRHLGKTNLERSSGRSSPAAAPDGLSGLNLGVPNVGTFMRDYRLIFTLYLRSQLFVRVRFHLLRLQIPPSCQLSQAKEIASDKEMLNLKRLVGFSAFLPQRTSLIRL